MPKLSGKSRTLDPASMGIKVTGRRGMKCQLPQAEYGVHLDISLIACAAGSSLTELPGGSGSSSDNTCSTYDPLWVQRRALSLAIFGGGTPCLTIVESDV
jgi:hypothetical protein